MQTTLRPQDRRFLAVCLLVCAAALSIGIRYFHRAFPEASIDFHVNRDSSQPVAETFLQAHGRAIAGYRHASSFRYDDESKVFLERELGLERANALMGTQIKLWRWSHRWFKPLEKEEVRVDVTTRGELAAFFHALPEEAAGADLPPGEARVLAESFLARTTGRPLETLEFVDSQTRKRPHRTDHLFTWKERGLELRDATYRFAVTVQGARVDGYEEFLKVPEQWQRDYARLRSLNESTSLVDGLLFALLGVAMLVSLGRQVRLRDVRWRTAVLFGAVAFALQLLATLNEWPLAEYGFDTTGSYASFASRLGLRAFLSALGFGGIILLLTACSEPEYRREYPSHLSISRMFSWTAVRSRSFFLAVAAGIALTFFFFAYEIGFYLLANKLGAWAPADIPYTELLNTRFPWVFVLLMGFFPAVSEEWMFRAFAIPYLGQLLRRRWIAVVLASFLWGFGHAAYPNQPFYIRGIEVGLVGLVLSWAMFRFGILAPLIAHYSIDAFYTAFLLLRSGDTYLMVSGALTAGINLVPLFVAAGAYVVTRRFSDESPVSNESEGTASTQLPPAPPEGKPAAVAYVPLGRGRAIAALALLGLGVGVSFVRIPQAGDAIAFRKSKPEAAGSATDFLKRMGFHTAGYRVIVQPEDRSDGLAAQYLYNGAGIRALNEVYLGQVRPVGWTVRFYRALQKEEFRVRVDPVTAEVTSFQRLLPEDAGNADLDQDRALAIARAFLENNGYDLARLEMKESKSEKPKSRRDTEFVWEARPGTEGAVGEARTRVRVGIQGDKVGSWIRQVKVPENWQRQRERQNWYSLTILGVRILLITILLAGATLQLVRGTRQGLVRWKLAAAVAALAVALELPNLLNSIPEVEFQYNTELSPQVFTVVGFVGAAFGLVGTGLFTLLAAGLIMSCYPDAPAILGGEHRRRWRRDALLAAAAILGVDLLLRALSSVTYYAASGLALAPSYVPPANLGTYFPAVSAIRDVWIQALLLAAAAAFAVHLWKSTSQKVWFRWLVLAALILSLFPVGARRFSEALTGAVPEMLGAGALAVIVAVFLRSNYLAYLLSPALLIAVRIGAPMFAQGSAALAVQGSLLGLVTVCGVAAMVRANHDSRWSQG